ncbi:MAG: GIY-YIG nuclease family protein [Propionibacteriales bacterium]|nr:GIY-YIG nuclease family protein [Propionibacteriales bacterium]
MAYVYILRCADGTYYVGSTTNLELRVWQHNSDDQGAVYTRKRRPVVLMWAAEFDSIVEAFAFEKRVQGWSRVKREALMRDDYELLPGLASRSYAGEKLRQRFRDVDWRGGT